MNLYYAKLIGKQGGDWNLRTVADMLEEMDLLEEDEATFFANHALEEVKEVAALIGIPYKRWPATAQVSPLPAWRQVS